MKKPRVDILVLVIALLLAVAMLLTLLYGGRTSRHGYGSLGDGRAALVQGAPLTIGNPFCAQA